MCVSTSGGRTIPSGEVGSNTGDHDRMPRYAVWGAISCLPHANECSRLVNSNRGVALLYRLNRSPRLSEGDQERQRKTSKGEAATSSLLQDEASHLDSMAGGNTLSLDSAGPNEVWRRSVHSCSVVKAVDWTFSHCSVCKQTRSTCLCQQLWCCNSPAVTGWVSVAQCPLAAINWVGLVLAIVRVWRACQLCGR